MALIIEDGSIVTGANSYVDVVGAVAYATAFGINIGTDDTITEQRLRKAMVYLENQEWRGNRSEAETQALAWPRYGVSYDGVYIDSDEIPQRLKDAQAQLVIEAMNGVEFWVSTSASTASRVVKRKKVDVLETEYMTPQELGETSRETASMPIVDQLLKPLLRTFRFGAIPTYRM